MQLVRMNIVATRDLDDRTLSHQAFLNDPQLLSRCPPPAPLRAGKYRHSHRVCPLICKSMGKPLTSTANPIGGLHRMRTPKLWLTKWVVTYANMTRPEANRSRRITPSIRARVSSWPLVPCCHEGGACWRKGWDSNPRGACAPGGFQDRCLKPLGHPSDADLFSTSGPWPIT